MSVQWILLVQLLTSLGDTEGVAFLRIELHLPSLGPVLEWSEVSLKLYLILDLYLLVTADFSVQEQPSAKKNKYVRVVDVLTNVIDVKEEH